MPHAESIASLCYFRADKLKTRALASILPMDATASVLHTQRECHNITKGAFTLPFAHYLRPTFVDVSTCFTAPRQYIKLLALSFLALLSLRV